MRVKVPPKVYWLTYAMVCLSFVALLTFYLSMIYTKQEPPKDVVVWLERLFTAFLGIVYTPYEQNGGGSGSKDAPPADSDTASPTDTGGSV